MLGHNMMRPIDFSYKIYQNITSFIKTMDFTTRDESGMSLDTDFNRQSSGKPTPQDVEAFIDAARSRDADTVKQYLARFSTGIVDAKDKNGDTALIWATRMVGLYAVAVLLLEGGANVDEKSDTGDTPLILAAKNRRLGITAQLLQRGAAIEEKNSDGHTALMCAEQSGGHEIISLIQGEQAERLEEAVEAIYRGITEDMDVRPIMLRKKGCAP
jgi:ankyrin repeat protein